MYLWCSGPTAYSRRDWSTLKIWDRHKNLFLRFVVKMWIENKNDAVKQCLTYIYNPYNVRFISVYITTSIVGVLILVLVILLVCCLYRLNKTPRSIRTNEKGHDQSQKLPS